MRELPENLKAAILHGEFMKCCADIERVGVPLDVPTLHYLQVNWDSIRRKLAGQALRKYPIFDGLHFSHEKFEVYLKANGLEGSWPRTPKSALRKTDKHTWKKQADLHPEIQGARDLCNILGTDKLNLACDSDGRNRVLLGAFGTITGRNAPSGEDKGTFIFGSAKWARFLIKPPRGLAVAYLDWASQEYGICAVLSGDKNMLRCYESGEPYLEFGILAGAAPAGATKASHPKIRKLYKSVTLGVGYGMRWWGLQRAAGVSEQVAQRLFTDYRRLFSDYCEWREKQVDEFGWRGRLTTLLGWPLHKSAETRENTVINFGAQGNAAEMLHLAVIEARFRGVEICATVHDAILIQAPVQKILQAIEKTKEAMAVASRTILSGYELRVDCAITRYPKRFYDEDGVKFWDQIRKL